MSTEHTPEPWITDEKDHDMPYQDIRIVSGRRGICTVWIDDAPVHDYNREQSANARLIAAAPDLLEACKLFVDYQNAAMAEDSPLEKYSTAMDAVYAAIAKATGVST